ncbi:alpha-1,3/1,6-mannosyltransferase ALG2 isoform X1 [Cricetulus griseus]|uniref:Alpha-1,3/1,6-mannosyltransferase ALG2 n=1 Tax=Cricetulus griseus TaxID=10029 RepID=A0A3L7I4P5_CRIGR|nr:alpha-1,3/1,6-mannosyltransferase ALG2 isoform X1 [Cricetulus griseus]ERE83343.1 alpha-1,3/1,6-mannosyltransferase ALG2 [Cricetulus griseus]
MAENLCRARARLYPPSVLFLHPDLGLGGAERLVLDAALALQDYGCDVKIWTAHYNPNHCFLETRELPVHCAGDWLPRSLGWGGRGAAICAYVRMVFLALYVLFLSGEEFDVVVCDQVSACIPVFKLARRRKRILFYCHYPDLLLSKRNSTVKRFYRAPLDWIEEYTTGMADRILVNSQYTASIFKETFKTLSHVNPDVLYPSLNIASFDLAVPDKIDDLVPKGKQFLFLSINRFERKKNLPLALSALVQLRGRLPSQDWEKVHLFMGGGYDDRILENVEHYKELKKIVQQSDLERHVTFLPSFSDRQKISLLHGCLCVLYTPSNEHFGIVPLEAMYMQCPVIAVNSGGPLESVVHKVTGFLCEPDPVHFSEAMEKFIHKPSLKAMMGLAGKARVAEKFSADVFADQLYQYVTKLV